MKEAARFFNTFLIKDPRAGWLISTPSNSPEQGGLAAGPTMDHQIIRTLFHSRDRCFKKIKYRSVIPVIHYNGEVDRIAPNQIRGRYGQLQEWLTDKGDTSSKHRHISDLGEYPGYEINLGSDIGRI